MLGISTSVLGAPSANPVCNTRSSHKAELDDVSSFSEENINYLILASGYVFGVEWLKIDV
jgi:hypothetical protein